MDVILTEDVKGKGKKNQIISVNNGYGNFLISNKKALLANDSNLNVLEENLKIEEEIQKENFEEALKLKELLESKTVKVFAKAGKDGRIFGAVSVKKVADILFNETKIKLDKKKIESKIPMNSLGVFKLDVKLHKGVSAVLTVQVLSNDK